MFGFLIFLRTDVSFLHDGRINKVKTLYLKINLAGLLYIFLPFLFFFLYENYNSSKCRQLSITLVHLSTGLKWISILFNFNSILFIIIVVLLLYFIYYYCYFIVIFYLLLLFYCYIFIIIVI